MKKIILCIFILSLCLVSAGSVMGESGEYTITVNKSTNSVTIYKQDEKGTYVPFKAMICSVGADNSTPAGVFNTKEKYVWRPLFGNVYGHPPR